MTIILGFIGGFVWDKWPKAAAWLTLGVMALSAISGPSGSAINPAFSGWTWRDAVGLVVGVLAGQSTAKEISK